MCLEGAAKSERGDETNFVPPYLPSVPVTNMDPDIRYSDLCISASIASINYGVALRLDLISCRNAFGGLRLPYNTTQPSSTPDTIKMPYKPPSPPFIRYAKLDPDPESSPRSKFRGCNLLYLTGPFRTIEYGGPTGSYGGALHNQQASPPHSLEEFSLSQSMPPCSSPPSPSSHVFRHGTEVWVCVVWCCVVPGEPQSRPGSACACAYSHHVGRLRVR